MATNHNTQKKRSLRAHLTSKVIDLTVAALLKAGHIFYHAHGLALWFPTMHKARKYFQPGKIYLFTGNPWLNMWDSEGAEAQAPNKTFGFFAMPLKRLPTGSTFMVLGVKRLAIDHVILNVLSEEQSGFIVLLSDTAAQPWDHFNRITA